MKTLRIAMVTGSLSHRGYGVRNAVELLSSRLARLGHEVMVFGLWDADWETAERSTWRGASTRALPFYGPANFGYTPSLTNEVLSFEPDIVHINGLWMYHCAVAPKIVKRTGAKLVVSPHGMMAVAAMHYSSLKKSLAMAAFQRACFEATDGFHATAKAEQDEIEAIVSCPRIEIVPNGLRISDSIDRPMGERQNRVIAIGRLHHKKGYDNLLRAWKTVESLFPNWTLEIRGPSAGDYAKQLVTLAAGLGLSRAIIGGAVDEDERDLLLGNSKLFVLSSHNENFALTVPEALFLRTPVLASKGTPWAGLESRACGWWVESDPKSLAEGLSQALAINDTLREKMGNYGRAWVEREFSADSAAQAMSKYYISLLSDRYSTKQMKSSCPASLRNAVR